MPYIPNRSAFVLVPEEPMLEWVREANDEDMDMETLFGEAEVYLLPSFETDEEMDKVLNQFWPRLFEIELRAWNRDPKSWPSNRTLDMFHEWFKLSPFNGVHDLGTEPIEVEKD